MSDNLPTSSQSYRGVFLHLYNPYAANPIPHADNVPMAANLTSRVKFEDKLDVQLLTDMFEWYNVYPIFSTLLS